MTRSYSPLLCTAYPPWLLQSVVKEHRELARQLPTGVLRVSDTEKFCGFGWVQNLMRMGHGIDLPLEEVQRELVSVVNNLQEDGIEPGHLYEVSLYALQPYYRCRIKDEGDREWTLEKVMLLTEDETLALQAAPGAPDLKPPKEPPYTQPEIILLTYRSLCKKHTVTPVEARIHGDLLTEGAVQDFLTRQEPAVLAYNICMRDHQVLALLAQV